MIVSAVNSATLLDPHDGQGMTSLPQLAAVRFCTSRRYETAHALEYMQDKRLQAGFALRTGESSEPIPARRGLSTWRPATIRCESIEAHLSKLTGQGERYESATATRP